MTAVGQRVFSFLETFRGLTAFLLITLGVAVTKYNESRSVIHPLIRKQITRTGVRLMPLILFLAAALGLVVIGQTIFLTSKVGNFQDLLGTVMVTVVVRELGPILAFLLVLARVGTANVIELGTARALGEVEALEALGIDPVHYLVVPRVIGLALATFALTIYLILFALLSGYLFAFLQNVPILPGDYFKQLAGALIWEDFVLLALKTCSFGVIIAIVTSYEGLAQPLHLNEVSGATTRAVIKCIVAAVLLDALFIIFYLAL